MRKLEFTARVVNCIFCNKESTVLVSESLDDSFKHFGCDHIMAAWYIEFILDKGLDPVEEFKKIHDLYMAIKRDVEEG